MMPAPNVPILHTRSLAAGHRGRALLQGLQLQLQRGELTCLLGPNGSGKSTLLHTLTGLLKPAGGEVWINGTPLQQLSPRQLAKNTSMVLAQKIAAVNLSVAEVVSLGRTPHTGWLGHLTNTDREAVQKAMRLVGVENFALRSINELSDGERQRVMIAKALAQDTPLVVLDEPTAWLDVTNRVALLYLLKELAGSTGKAILLSTHELELAIQLAGTVWLIDPQGRLQTGAPEDLVLAGALGETFHGEHIHFDQQSGTFKIRHKTTRHIYLQGQGLPAFWTRHALQKEGYQVNSSPDESDLQVRVTMQNPPRWEISHLGGTATAGSIAGLRQLLRKLERK